MGNPNKFTFLLAYFLKWWITYSMNMNAMFLMVGHCFIEYHGNEEKHEAQLQSHNADFTIKHFATLTVNSDGHECGTSIKNTVHQRRGYNFHPTVSSTSDTGSM